MEYLRTAACLAPHWVHVSVTVSTSECLWLLQIADSLHPVSATNSSLLCKHTRVK